MIRLFTDYQTRVAYQFYICKHGMPPSCLSRHPAGDARVLSDTGCRIGAEARLEA